MFDGAGAALSTRDAPIWLYVSQPVLRFEDFAFNRGTILDPSVQPAVITGKASMRETRVGLTASYRMLHRLRLGAGAEWTRRDDRYDTDEVSGAPDQGSRHLDFSGDAIGGTLGFRFDSADSGAGTWTVGGALRYLPKSIIHRRKRGLSVPLSSWLRGPLTEWAESRLRSEWFSQVGVNRSAALELLTAGLLWWYRDVFVR